MERAFSLFFGDAAPSLSKFVVEETANLLAARSVKVSSVAVTIDGKRHKVKQVEAALELIGECERQSKSASAFLMGATKRTKEEEGAPRAYVAGESRAPWVANRFGFIGGIVLPLPWVDEAWVDRCVRRAVADAGCEYMFATEWPYLWGPLSFIGGASVIPFPEWPAPNDEDQYRTNQWRIQMQDGFRFRDGWLRDVFEVNWLNPKQLDMLVFGLSLREWIAENSERGSLGELSWGFSKWIVAHELIPAVRRSLDSTGLLLAGRRSSVNLNAPQ